MFFVFIQAEGEGELMENKTLIELATEIQKDYPDIKKFIVLGFNNTGTKVQFLQDSVGGINVLEELSLLEVKRNNIMRYLSGENHIEMGEK